MVFIWPEPYSVRHRRSIYADCSSLNPCTRQTGGVIRLGHHLGALDVGSALPNRFGFLRLNPAQYRVSQRGLPTL